MKNKKYPKLTRYVAISFLLLSFLYSCSKDANNKENKDCGCNTDKYTEVKDQSGLLVRRNNAWVLANDSTQFPAFTGLICNEKSEIIKDFVKGRTSDSLAVLFSGKRSGICDDNRPHILSAGYYPFNITVDSLKPR